MDDEANHTPAQDPGAPESPAEPTPAAEVAVTTPPDPRARLPEDLRVPWDWLDVVVFAMFGLGSLLVLRDPAALLILILSGVPPAQLESHALARAAFITLHQWMWYATVMVFLLGMIRLRFRAPFWRTLGFRPFHVTGGTPAMGYLACLAGGSVLSILVQYASALARPTEKLPIEKLFGTPQGLLLLTGTAVLLAPLMEEIFFRGYLYPVLARGLGISGGVLVTGFLFGLMHFGQLQGGPWQMVLITIVGIVFTYVRARTGSTLATYLLHLGYNGIIFVFTLILTRGFRHLPGQ